MTKQLLIYTNVVPVNRETHRSVSVRQTTDFQFAKETNSVPIVDIEFLKVMPEMPIVFARTQTGIVTVALVGTNQNINSFVNSESGWDGKYIPAFFRRYPFVFAVEENNSRMTLCIDADYDGLNEEDKGERMFDSDGNETAYTKQVLRFAEEYQATFNRTQAFCDRLEQLELLEEARIDYTLADGNTGGVTGFMRVSIDKLRALDDEKLVELFRSGDLDLIQLHLASMQQVESLVNKSAAAQASASTGENQADDISDEDIDSVDEDDTVPSASVH